MRHQARLFVSKTCKENLVMNVNVAERGYSVAGLQSRIAISWHYAKDRLQSLRELPSARGIVRLKPDGHTMPHGRGSEGETGEWSG